MPAGCWADVVGGLMGEGDPAESIGDWRIKLERAGADVLVADYAPAAVLAARAAGVACVTVGTGFARPPASRVGADLRRLAGLARGDDPAIPARSAAVARRLSDASLANGGPGLGELADLYCGLIDLRFGLPEIDPYGEPADDDPDLRWLGPLPPPEHPDPRWPAGAGPRVLVHCREFPALRAAVAAWVGRGWRVLRAGRSAAPVNISRACAEADLLVCDASYGVVAQGVLAGRPMLLLPADLEKGLIAARVVAAGAGRVADARDAAAVASAGQRHLADGRAREAAAGLASRHDRHDPRQALNLACDLIESAANRGPP